MYKYLDCTAKEVFKGKRGNTLSTKTTLKAMKNS